MSERTMEKARQVVHKLSEWYFAQGGDESPDAPFDRADLDALHDLVRTAEATAEMERRQAGAYAAVAAVVRRELEAPGAGEDVRERVDVPGLPDGITPLTGVFTTHHAGRPHAIVLWQGAPWLVWQHPDGHWVTEAEVQVLALLRTPRGEGEEDGGEFCDLCGEEFDPSEFGTVIGPLGQDDGVPRWYRCPRCARAYDAGYQQGQRDPRGDETADPTAPRSDAQGEDRWEDLIFGTLIEAYNEAHAARRSDAQEGEADALDLIRWAESHHAALEPVVGNIMPPGTYACYVGDADDPYMGPGILGAIRAARRGEAPGDGPVGAVCANCGDPNAAITGGELDPDEAVCSVECYEQLMELGCPQAHGGTYRPKPARRGEGEGLT